MINPSVEPLYTTSLEEVFWGVILVGITMAMHGFGMMAVLRVNHAVKNWFKRKTGIVSGLFPVILASWMIMLVHLTEVGVWAMFFLWQGAFPNRSLAYYFSLNEYTTVGSNFNLPLPWRLLEGMIATAGLLTFAWSTGILITLAQEFQEQRMQLFKQRHGQE
ncbi:MAG: hypothetical protein WAO02_10395 [Verrucomicrobiia bacterium]